ncbi:MAG: ABC transporter permease [Candidatus Aenigmatarchaeota archaeon]
MILESLKISFDSFKHRKVSSILTVIGIVIGIAAIISLVSIGEGLRQAVSKQLEAFGSDKIIVSPSSAGGLGFGFLGEGLKEEDVKKIERIDGVKTAAGVLFKTLPLTFKKETQTTYVVGVNAKDAEKVFLDIQSFELREGRYFKEGESGLIVIGSLVSEKMFSKEVKIGDIVYIKNKKFKVVGIMKSMGSRQDDSQVYVSLDDLREIVGNENTLNFVFAKVSDVSRVNEIAEEIEKKLEKDYGKNTYNAMTSQQIAERVGSIISILSFVLGGIASISLLVAGVGIANTMFTSVLERTREIGIMKAIGATNYNVMEIFLVESALLGFFGGVGGCIVGFVLSKLISIFAINILPVEFSTVVTSEMILLSLAFAVVVGIVSGLVPARKAAKLQPVDALRYE